MAQNIQMCQVPDGLKDKLKKFRFRKEKNNAALILKVNFKKEEVEVEEEYEDCSVDELESVKPELAMMYAGVLSRLKDDLGMTKVFELRDKEEFTEEWLKKKLEFF